MSPVIIEDAFSASGYEDLIKKELAERAAAEAAEKARREAEEKAAAEAHAAAIQNARDDHEVLIAAVQGMHDDLEASLTKAATERSHLPYVTSYLRDLHLMIAEKRAWIKRNL